MRGRIRSSWIGDFGHESGVSVVDVVGDSLNSAVGKEDVVLAFGGVPVSGLLVAEIDSLDNINKSNMNYIYRLTAVIN